MHVAVRRVARAAAEPIALDVEEVNVRTDAVIVLERRRKRDPKLGEGPPDADGPVAEVLEMDGADAERTDDRAQRRGEVFPLDHEAGGRLGDWQPVVQRMVDAAVEHLGQMDAVRLGHRDHHPRQPHRLHEVADVKLGAAARTVERGVEENEKGRLARRASPLHREVQVRVHRGQRVRLDEARDLLEVRRVKSFERPVVLTLQVVRRRVAERSAALVIDEGVVGEPDAEADGERALGEIILLAEAAPEFLFVEEADRVEHGVREVHAEPVRARQIGAQAKARLRDEP